MQPIAKKERNAFEKKSLLCSPRLHLFDLKTVKNSEILLQHKNNCSILIYFKM